MARETTLIFALVVLAAWVLVLTFYPRLTAPEMYPYENTLEDIKRGVLRQEKRQYFKDSGRTENATKKKIRRKSVDSIENPIIREEARRVLSIADSPNSRAAFDKVVALSSLLPRITNISRMQTPSPDTFRNYIAPMGLPVIFTDMLEGQKLGKWTWEYVRSKWGDIVYHNTRQGNYSTKMSRNGKHYINRVTVTLGDFIDVVTGKRKASKMEEGMYIAKKRLIPVDALEEEFYYPPFYLGVHKKCYLEPSGWYVDLYCWKMITIPLSLSFRIGSPGTFTQGHIDSKDNFVYQVIGRKRWTIFSPQDYKFLYYKKTKGSLEWSAVLNSFEVNPDLKKYPLFKKTTPLTIEMNPGEVLYLPRGWTHTVANLTPNLMINTWRYGPAAITQFWLDENDREIRKHCY